jgi:hypothetical protein
MTDSKKTHPTGTLESNDSNIDRCTALYGRQGSRVRMTREPAKMSNHDIMTA